MPDEPLKTPLNALHRRLGARMVPFAGYDMPVNYQLGVLKEHLHCRSAAGLFDVSHMGQIALRPKSGDLADAAQALERMVPVDVLGLASGRQRYALFTDRTGGILDDLMVANRGDHLFLVVNAACKAADEAHLRAHLSDDVDIEVLDRALLALQGPRAAEVLAALAPEIADMRFMDVADLPLDGVPAIVSRSGYTGEDGFEISVPSQSVEGLAETLLADPAVEPIGLGARDSLRVEAGLCLYGSDITVETTPVAAGLGWAIQKVRREGGARAGGFPGAETVLREFAHPTAPRRVGLRIEGKAPIRAGAPLFAAEEGGEPVGTVTSGVFGPSIGAPVAMGYVDLLQAGTGTALFAEVRGRRLPVSVSDMPFITTGYKR